MSSPEFSKKKLTIAAKVAQAIQNQSMEKEKHVNFEAKDEESTNNQNSNGSNSIAELLSSLNKQSI